MHDSTKIVTAHIHRELIDHIIGTLDSLWRSDDGALDAVIRFQYYYYYYRSNDKSVTMQMQRIDRVRRANENGKYRSDGWHRRFRRHCAIVS